MGKQEQVKGLPSWISEHLKLYREDPEKGHLWDSSPVGGPGILTCLLLITRGRKSGNISTLPLIYADYESAFVIVASKGGAPTHPAWYLNLEAEPECEIQVASDRYAVRARTTQGVERESLWRLMTQIYPPYEDYQVSAPDRLIPVVVLSVLEPHTNKNDAATHEQVQRDRLTVNQNG